MLHLAVRMAGHRITALLAVACAVLGGAALITGTGVLAESGFRSQLPAGRLAGAEVVVSTEQSFSSGPDLPIALPERGTVPAELVDELAQLPGVTAAVGDISFPAALVDADGQVVPTQDPRTAGHGWSSTKLLVDAKVDGSAPAGTGEVALDSATAATAGVQVGDKVEVVAAGRAAAAYRVTALVDAPDTGILFADPTAVRLSGRADGERAGTVDLVALRTEPGTEASVAAAAREKIKDTRKGTAKNTDTGTDASASTDTDAPAGLIVSTGSERGDIASPGAGAARSLLILLASSLGGIIMLIIGFVMASALAVSIGGQRRDLALMRAVGATPKQIRRLAAGQASIIAAVAVVPGVGLGYLLAGQFRSMLVDRGVIPEALPLTFSPLPALATVLLLGLAVQVSARSAAWRTSRMPATEAVAESRSEPRTPSKMRARFGLLLIVAATTLSVVPLLSRTVLGATATSMAGIIGAIGLALAGPALVRGIGDAAGRRLRPGVSAPTWLAVSNIRGYALRLSGVVSALAMAVVFVLTYTLAQTTVMSATAQDTRTGTLAQQRLTAPGLGGLPAGTLAAVTRTSGVEAAAPVSDTTVIREYEQFGDPVVESGSAMVLTPAASGVLDLGVRDGSLARLKGDTVAVSTEVARSPGSGLGSRITLVLGDGTRVSPKVVAVYDRGLGFGPIALSHDLAAGHTTAGLDQSVLVRTDGTEAAQRALTALAAARPGLALAPTDTGSGDSLSDAPPTVWINLALIVVLLGYLLLSIANKLVATTAQRQGEIATLRLNGTTPRQILAMMRREAAVIGAAALTAGLLLSAIPLALLGIGFLDRPWPAGPVWLLPAVALTVICTAFITVELPTRQALRTAPAHALSARE
ncbi:putative ABC transport system permease protein [Streptomyces umbrinus]|uniref:ABC transporter permease n=1 Tax=Streptomyces TaxID=1883 RepID=UPI00167E3194|nr:ABC transporter permease [Streptomyces umbrinus]MCR3725312.1 putative ABC transport system permease protein [Streptomyces umbrinus]GHH45164.1 membrane protein [Streptomyces umbrinus]